MKIKKFIAASLPEALSKVKEDFGEDAVILKTRFSSKNGTSGKNLKSVEVTAAIDENAPKVANPETKTIKSPAGTNRLLTTETIRPMEMRQTPNESLNDIKIELSSLKKEMELSRTQSLFGQPSGIFLDIARQLVSSNLPESIAIEVAKRLQAEGATFLGTDAAWLKAKSILAGMLSPGDPIRMADSGSTVVMLIGPSGAGKSSAAARLAFHYSVEKRIPVTLITTDTFRADSREQIKSLSNVIGCPFASVSSPEELLVALRSYKDGLIIVDTSGAGNDAEILELESMIGAANPHEVHLVVPADIPADDAKRLIENHPDLRINKILVTKLDQSRCRGGIMAAVIENNLRFSFQSASREIPGFFGTFDQENFIDAFLPSKATTQRESEEIYEVVK